MITDILLSFIIPAYNAADTIEKAVQSLTDMPRTEVLIVENGSTDVIESVMYFAVPCFFMISGANLMDYRKRYDTKTFLIKRTKKTIIPYIFWSLFGIGFGIWMNTLRWEDVTIKYVVNGLINGSLVRIFWFFIPLYIVYLIHWFVLTAILRFVNINTTLISWRLIAPFGIVAISIGIICIIRKIPILRRVIP